MSEWWKGGTWSNRETAPPLSLDMLKRAMQRLTICGLCGLKVGKDRIVEIAGWIAHAACARGKT